MEFSKGHFLCKRMLNFHGALRCAYMYRLQELFFSPNGMQLESLKPTPIAQLVEFPLRGTGGHGFITGSR